MNDPVTLPPAMPAPIDPAPPYLDDPTAILEAHYRQVWAMRRHEFANTNDNLDVEAIGFVCYAGDWLGVVVTPWFLDLFLIPGGGQLWGDIPAGQRRYLNLPCGTLQFIAGDDPEIGPYQHAPLIAPVSGIPDMATARQAAVDAMHAVLLIPPPIQPATETPRAAPVSRRGFFRRLAGRSA